MTTDNQLSSTDAERILKRVSELESGDDESALSVDELRAIAAEAGFDPENVDKAISETLNPDMPTDYEGVESSGFVVTRYNASRIVDAQLTPNELLRAVDLFTAYFEQTPDVQLKTGKVVWRDKRRFSFELIPSQDATGVKVLSPRLVGQKAGWKGDVARAADRLAAVVSYVASERAGGGARGMGGEPSA